MFNIVTGSDDVSSRGQKTLKCDPAIRESANYDV